jgi:hypothetical protein
MAARTCGLLLASACCCLARSSHPPLAFTSTPLRNTSNLTYWCEGDCNAAAQDAAAHEPGVVLMGGGDDVDKAFQAMIGWGAGGNFLVLRTYGDDAYNPYIRGLGNTTSVATLLTKGRAASSDPFALELVDRADVIFFAGGNQDDYISQWQGTPLQARLQAALDERRVPMGGTSAGCDIQGSSIYTAADNGTSVQSSEALEDPYNECVPSWSERMWCMGCERSRSVLLINNTTHMCMQLQ